MFGSNPFGQSSSSPFGSPSMFGQTSSTTTNPFAPKPFGGTTNGPFGTQTGSSIFGSTSTGVFGQTPSPLSTTPAFGASSTPAFGSSTPSFGASSTSAFGGGSSSFGGSSLFGQKPAFGGFGSTSSQSSPFGSTFQQTQPAFGSTPFGSTAPFGASSQPAFGSTSTPAFGSTSTPAFGSTTTPVFGATSTPAFGATSTPAFGATSTPAFGSTTAPSFGSTGSAFGVSSTPAFGAGSLFGSSSTPAFGQSSTPAFGQSSTPAFGQSSTPAFGQSSTPSFGFGSAPTFGQSSSAFGSTFGAPSFGSQSSTFGGQTATPTFGSPGFGQATFGGQRGGSRAVAYSPTVDTDGATGTQPAGKLESISAMPAYKEKSHEELRWEDYQQGDKGGPTPAGQTGTGAGFSALAQTNLFGSTSTVQTNPFGQASASTFSSSGGLFGQKTPSFSTPGFGSSSAPAFSSPFGSTSSSPFGPTSTAAPLFSSSSVSAFGGSTTPSIFGNSVTAAFGTSTPFGSSAAAGSTPAFGSGLSFGNTQSAGLFQSSPATLQAPSIFGQSTTGFGQTSSTFGSNLFNTQSSAFGGSLFGSSSSAASSGTSLGFGQSTPSFSSPFQTPAQNLTPGNFSFGNIGQTQTVPSSGFGSTPNMLGQAAFGQSSANQTSVVVQPAPITNPFGSLPAMPQMSIGQAGLASPIQYGISSMPVSEKPTPVRNSSLLIPRHFSQRRIKLPARKYHPKIDGPRVPFFCSEEEAPSTPKADALFIPRENPRSLIIRPIEQWPGKNDVVRKSLPITDSNPIYENGHSSDKNGHVGDQTGPSPSKSSLKINGIHEEQTENGVESSYMTISGHRAGKAAIVYEHGADIEALMPKLRHPEYYTEPRIQELAAKERAEPGFCRHVKDFVVGRHGYGNIKFDDETDVRRLDLESLVQFNHREVIVYKDESKKPPVGQGLNKPAQVTLLNVKCMDKKTGRQFSDGPKVERYKELLKRKTTEQGAEFISYDPVKGEWKFRVEHFSHYEFEDEDLGECSNRAFGAQNGG